MAKGEMFVKRKTPRQRSSTISSVDTECVLPYNETLRMDGNTVSADLRFSMAKTICASMNKPTTIKIPGSP